MKKICLFIGIILLSIVTKVEALEQKLIISNDNLLVLNGVFDEVVGVQIELVLSSGSFKDSKVELSNSDNSMYTIDNNKLVIYIYSTDNLTINNNITLGKISIVGDYVYSNSSSIKLIDEELNEIDNSILVTGNTSYVTVSNNNGNSNNNNNNNNSNSDSNNNSNDDTSSDEETTNTEVFDLMMSLVSDNIMQSMADSNLENDIYINLDDISYKFLQNSISYDGEIEYDFGFSNDSSFNDLIISLIPDVYLETINFNYHGNMPLNSGYKANVNINVGKEYSDMLVYYYLFDKITNEFTLIDYSIVNEDGILNVNQTVFGTYVLTNNVIDIEDELEEYLPEIEDESDDTSSFKLGFLIIILIILLITIIVFIVRVRKNNKNLRSSGFY